MLDQLWLLLCSGLVFLMQAGFMCLESGLTRSKNSINVAVKNIADFGISVFLFWAFGFALMFGTSQWGWLGLNNFFPSGDNHNLTVFFIYQSMFCGTATTIISGAVAERLKFTAYIIIATLVASLIYPIFGHWAWNESGWLKGLGFVDFAGSTVVHSVGAWVSLATLTIIGARQGRFTSNGTVSKIQGANLPFAVMGALLLWVGWLGFNGGSTLGFNEQVPLIIFNTILSGVSGMIAAMFLSHWRYRRIEVEELINGSLAGLVAITASCNLVSAPLAVIIGAVGAIISHYVSRYLQYLRLDDAVDAIAVHGGAGVWGTLCVALFGNLLGVNRLGQLGVQFLGISVCGVWSFGVSWCLLKLLHSYWGLRVSSEGEEIGLNFAEHQAKTETYDLFQVMDLQAKTQDLSLRVPVEPFTEIGHIATRYNQMMDALEKNHRETTESLEELYAVTATAVAALETEEFSAADFSIYASRPDELGILARVLQQMSEMINQQYEEMHNSRVKLQELIILILNQRFSGVSPVLIEGIKEVENLEILSHLLQQAIASDSLEKIEFLLTQKV